MRKGRWPCVPGTVMRCKLREKNNLSLGHTAYEFSTWQIKVVYSYQADGKRCYGEQDIWPKVRAKPHAERLCEYYEKNPDVQVRVNPDDPTDSVLVE